MKKFKLSNPIFKKAASFTVAFALVLATVLVAAPIGIKASADTEIPVIQVQDFEGIEPTLSHADDGTGSFEILPNTGDSVNASKTLVLTRETGNIGVKISGLSLKANTAYQVCLKYKYIPSGADTDTWFYILSNSSKYAKYDGNISTWGIYSVAVTPTSDISNFQINLNRSGSLYIDDIIIVEGNQPYYYCDFEDANASEAKVHYNPKSVQAELFTEGAYSGNSLALTPSAGTTVYFPMLLMANKTYKVSFAAKTPEWNYFLSNSGWGITYANWTTTPIEKTYTPTTNTLFHVNIFASGRNFYIDNIKIQEQKALSASVANSIGGTAAITGDATTGFYGDKITYTATAANGYTFVNWTNSKGNPVSTNASYEHTIGDDNALTANFTHQHSWASIWSNNGTHHWHNCTATGCTITLDSQKDSYGTHNATDDNDCTTEVKCTICDKITVEAKTAHEPNTDDGDCTTAVTCKNCSTVTTPAKTAHEPNNDDGDCTTAITCKNCNKVTTPAASAHTPKADDGDCTTAVECSVCDKIAIAAKTAHEPNNDDGDCTTAVTCKNCSTATTPAKTAHEPNDDDGDCTTAITCKNCNKVTTPAASAHTPKTDDGDCTTAVECSVCDKIAIAAQEEHTPEADDGDCTTAVKCQDCDKIVVEAKVHGLKKIEAKAANKNADGNIEYWYCEDCNKYFSDAEGKKEITKDDTITKYAVSPQTNDNIFNHTVVVLLTIIIAATSLAFTLKAKKKVN